MTAAEARKKQWQSLKDQPLSAKLKYIFTYYWPGILGGLSVLIFLVSWITNIVTAKDVALGGYILNGMPSFSYNGDIQQEFIQHQKIDTDDYEFRLSIDSSLNSDTIDVALITMESISVQIATGELDFIVGDENTFQVFSAYYTDLRNVMTPEQLNQWKDLLVYVEKAELDELTSDNFDSKVVFPTYHLSNEGLQDPIPIAVRLPAASKLNHAYTFPKGEVFFGIVHNAPNRETALSFLAYILK